ncbi:uncharacterized protein MKZ38_009787 [Zalerion maritima]|uniref:Cytochrome c oxidase assembly protein n=1 Tax=Zalerion maritima TaxID=339359 RepID=A0AAD5S0E5_9PEZI|nr:uncharacterized protein MKZ38_009787 [Zalerion maritima]
MTGHSALGAILQGSTANRFGDLSKAPRETSFDVSPLRRNFSTTLSFTDDEFLSASLGANSPVANELGVHGLPKRDNATTDSSDLESFENSSSGCGPVLDTSYWQTLRDDKRRSRGGCREEEDGGILCAENYVLSVILATVGLSYGSVPLYKMICATTGWGGQPIRAHQYVTSDGSNPATRMIPVTDAPRIKVQFAASVSDVLPWKFIPQQREVKVLPGETALAFYKAYNNSDKDIIGVATYSVTPAQLAPYFSKIQCFCFEEQRLNAGEEVDMPVFFYLDPDLLNDLNVRGVETVTLHYTFFKARYDDNGRIQGLPSPV